MSACNEEKLDAEFRQVLYLIKPHIIHINDPYQIEQYKIWLERLNSAPREEKFVRNMYVVELANQIHDGVIRPPFTHNPPKVLRNLQAFEGEKMDHAEWPYVRQTIPLETPPPAPASPRRKINKLKAVRPFTPIAKTCSYFTSTRSSADGSWLDLTETSASTESALHPKNSQKDDNNEKNMRARGDTTDLDNFTEDDDIDSSKIMQKHREKAMKIRDRYERRHRREAESRKMHFPKLDLERFSRKCQETEKLIENLPEESCVEEEELNSAPLSPSSQTDKEVEALKMRINDLLEVKKALKDARCLTAARKRAIEDLNSKVKHSEKRNMEYQRIITSQKRKLTELEAQKSRELKEFKETFTNLHSTEIDFLKQRHTKEIQSVENKCKSQIEELEQRYKKEIQELKKQYDQEITNLSTAHDESLKEKECEITQLLGEAKARGDDIMATMDQTVEINHLKKCIAKLDKLLNKNEKEYLRKIEKLKQELDMKEMVSQVQLQTQKADLMVRNSATRQEELKFSLNSLELKYKQMIDDLQQQSRESKKRDEKIILQLKEILEEHQIYYEIEVQ